MSSAIAPTSSQREAINLAILQLIARLPRSCGLIAEPGVAIAPDQSPSYLDRNVPRDPLTDLRVSAANALQIYRRGSDLLLVILKAYGVFVDGRTGAVYPFLFAAAPDGHRPLFAKAAGELGLDGLPAEPRLIRQWLRNWCWQRGLSCDSDNRFAEGWLDGEAFMLRNEVDWHAFYEQVSNALALRSRPYRLVDQVLERIRRPLTHRHYNVVVLGQRAIALLQAEAHGLLIPWVLLAANHDIDPTAEPKKALKQWVLLHGGTPALWRALAASEADIWIVRFRMSYAGSLTFCLEQTIQLLGQMKPQGSIPPGFMALAFSRIDERYRFTGNLAARRIVHWPIALKAARQLREEAAWAAFEAEFSLVDHWVDVERPTLDKNQQRRGWPWLVKAATAWTDRRTQRLRHSKPLAPELPAFVGDGLTFEFVRSRFELWTASRQLRNCLDDRRYARRLSTGKSLIAVVRRTGQNTPIAAIELERSSGSGQLRLGQVASFANNPAPPDVHDQVAAFLRHAAAAAGCPLVSPWRPEAKPPALPAEPLPAPQPAAEAAADEAGPPPAQASAQPEPTARARRRSILLATDPDTAAEFDRVSGLLTGTWWRLMSGDQIEPDARTRVTFDYLHTLYNHDLRTKLMAVRATVDGTRLLAIVRCPKFAERSALEAILEELRSFGGPRIDAVLDPGGLQLRYPAIRLSASR